MQICAEISLRPDLCQRIFLSCSQASPSQSIRSRDSGIPEDVVQAEKYKAVSHTPLQKPARRTYYGYEDESDYEDYRPTDAFDNEDYSVSQSDAPNLAMLGNESDSPNEFYHSSDEGIPDYYLDSDGILWDETVLSSGKALTERAGLHRTSPSGSESGGQVIQTNTPADIYANTIKARTSFSTTQKPPFPHQSSSRRNSINQPSPSKYASPTGSGGKNANKSVSSKNEQPYNKEDYIKSVKNNARVNASPSSTDATASATRAKSKDKRDIKSDHGKKSKSRQNSSSSGDNATPKSKSSLNSGNVFVAIADVHVNATLSDSDTAETLKRPIPAKRGKKSEAHAIPEEDGSKGGTRNHGSFPRDREKSEHLLQVKEESPQFNSLPSRNVQKHLSNSSDTPLTSESTDISFETVKQKSIKKQPSIGKINSTDRPPKPLRQSSTGSTTSHDNSQTLSDKAKASPAPVNTGVKTPDEAASPKRGQLQPKLSRDLSVNIPEDSIHSVSPIRIQMEDLQMMTDVEEDPTLHDAGVGPSGPQPSARVEEIKRRRLTLMCVFLYLDTKTLSQLSLVCKEWKVVSRHPALWRRVRLRNARIGSKYLMTISKWCVQLESLTLEALKPRRKRKDETDEDYAKNTRGCLEQGLETLLMVSQNSLLSLRIASCDNIITEKCLWEVSCYSRLLQRLCYISSMDPLGPEVMWNMGAGCRDIVTLIIPPGVPNKKPGRFNNKCVQLIGQFYPELKVLSIGGAEVDERGLLALAKQCQRLQVLEFDHMKEITEEVAQTLCDAGLKDLQTLEFTNTPVTPKAVHLFSKNCRRLRRINVRVAISDYFEDTLLKENVDHFKNVVEKFNSLKKRSNLSSVLRIKTDAEGKQRLRST
ncbi:dentin sialophosphoprotein-like [Liolophura sinensis]|uniref:dentin sialophosphoprotein-like n=1 Tax=Liolophura sinensis TaxID=3198878 RepID=UPI003159133F